MMRGRAEPQRDSRGREVPVVNEGDCVAIFHSIHRVMKAEKVLLQQQVEMTLIPVPRQLSADCGMAIRFSIDLLDHVQSILTGAQLKIAELWQLRNGQYELLK